MPILTILTYVHPQTILPDIYVYSHVYHKLLSFDLYVQLKDALD
jgi:hypothetical protein